MKTIIYKGTHFSLPPFFRKGNDIDWEYEFIVTSPYHIEGEDQLDWNKLVGIKTNYFKPMYKSVMIGWRYNPQTSLNEYCFYEHTSEGRVISPIIASASLDTKVSVRFKRISPSQIETTFTVGSVSKSTLSTLEGTCYLINTWFGGTSPAPTKIIIKRNKVR